MENCVFCQTDLDGEQEVVFENDTCMFLQKEQRILTGSGLIVPKAHKETVFDLSEDEWADTQSLMLEVKQWMDVTYKPDGYNIGWNSGAAGGQHIFHAHMHIIPRFAEESYAGKGIRHWLKQESNRRIT
ncbi:HIT family protein [Halobacillus yeomjeoni]|uniref:HIT domain-containing protein n=1 Tax=Halobacillus yeomjeoni TaxID=311194 RepID=A0A931HUH9_9BACI|nr:HIT domain-containing protein [Halobacillus yeomjeoni]MBH0229658.1 HIT domain-containing protein [Halobacillus yeomjeoni]